MKVCLFFKSARSYLRSEKRLFCTTIQNIASSTNSLNFNSYDYMKSKFLNVKKFSINLHFILISSFQLMALPSFSESIVDCQLSVCSSACTVPPSLPFLTSLLFQFLPTFCLLSLNQSLLISCHSSVFPDSFNEIITSSYYSRAPT